MNKEENHYWLSFSYKGKNQGCIVTKSTTKYQAFTKCANNNLIPLHDHYVVIRCQEEELEYDKLISPEELKEKGYSKL